jgi:hypothetical protein
MSEDFEDGDWEEDFELSPEDIASIKRGIQEANDGLTYTMLKTEDGSFAFKCNKCGRSAELHERPFPHKLNCPMRKL